MQALQPAEMRSFASNQFSPRRLSIFNLTSVSVAGEAPDSADDGGSDPEEGFLNDVGFAGSGREAAEGPVRRRREDEDVWEPTADMLAEYEAAQEGDPGILSVVTRNLDCRCSLRQPVSYLSCVIASTDPGCDCPSGQLLVALQIFSPQFVGK